VYGLDWQDNKYLKQKSHLLFAEDGFSGNQ
jgi:hypothetical protein